MIVSSATSSPQFAQIYSTKYLKPRRQAFAVVVERAKRRNEIEVDTDPDLIFDLISGVMLYSQVFQPTNESWEAYIRRALACLLKVSTL